MGVSTLIIDADSGSREALARTLKDAGYPVLTAGSGSEGLAVLSSLRPQVALLDIGLPGEDGLGLLRRIRLEHPDVALIALSSVSEPGLIVRAMREGAADFVGKPASPDTLLAALKGAVTRGDSMAAPELPVAPISNGGDRFWPDLDLLFRNSEKMRAVEYIVRRAADTNATILLQGESGTGKEMVAKSVHYVSGRRDHPFVKVNCAALPGDLLESELFGHENGAFTGAHEAQARQVRARQRGHHLPRRDRRDAAGPAGQAAARAAGRRVLARRRQRADERVDVRVIAATNRDLDER